MQKQYRKTCFKTVLHNTVFHKNLINFSIHFFESYLDLQIGKEYTFSKGFKNVRSKANKS